MRFNVELFRNDNPLVKFHLDNPFLPGSRVIKPVNNEIIKEIFVFNGEGEYWVCSDRHSIEHELTKESYRIRNNLMYIIRKLYLKQELTEDEDTYFSAVILTDSEALLEMIPIIPQIKSALGIVKDFNTFRYPNCYPGIVKEYITRPVTRVLCENIVSRLSSSVLACDGMGPQHGYIAVNAQGAPRYYDSQFAHSDIGDNTWSDNIEPNDIEFNDSDYDLLSVLTSGNDDEYCFDERGFYTFSESHPIRRLFSSGDKTKIAKFSKLISIVTEDK